MTKPIRVMVVDDSSVARGLITQILNSEPDIEVVAKANDGKTAIEMLQKKDAEGNTLQVEVITLDNHMPHLNGIDALPEIRKLAPRSKVLMSTLMSKNAAELTMKALALGAADIFSKPEAHGNRSAILSYGQELIQKVRALGQAALSEGQGGGISSAPGVAVMERKPAALQPEKIDLKPLPLIFKPNLIAIGSSTGGPQALTDIFKAFSGKKLRVPIVITQHMPAEFTTLLAEQLAKISGIPAMEGKDGALLEPGKIYVAPGGYHMLIRDENKQLKLQLTQDAPEHFCRPAVDPMLRSIAAIPSLKPLVVILTGMGADGALGAKQAQEKGAVVVAQDQASSVVWGMPGATARSGCCSFVIPLNEIPSKIIELSAGAIQ